MVAPSLGGGSGLQRVGVRAVVEGVAQYNAAAAQVQRANTQIGSSATVAATKTRAASESMRLFGQRLREVGTQAVIAGAALAAPGLIASKLAADFESAMTRIITLVGLTKEEVEGMSEAVLALSEETARSPKELAEALFVVTSAGARGATAMSILEQAAKASAIGLGNTAAIARTVTAAVTAFGEENLDAARATNVLVATVREGNLEAASLASTLGRVLGPAASVGVAFEDVGAFIAVYTRLGGDAAEATTALRQTFNALIKPGSDAEKALEAAGLSAQGLREQMREEGLVETLITLNDAFDGNVEGLARVIPNVRALTGVLNTVGTQEEEFVRITQDMRKELNLVEEGFATVQTTAGQQFKQTLNSITVEITKIGADVLPTLQRVIGVVGAMVEVFSSLPGPVKEGVFVFGLLAGAAFLVTGSIALLTGAMIAAAGGIATMTTAITGSAGLAAGLSVLAGPVGIAALAAVVALGAIEWLNYRDSANEAADALRNVEEAERLALTGTLDRINLALAARRAEQQSIQEEIEALKALQFSGLQAQTLDQKRQEDIARLEERYQALAGQIIELDAATRRAASEFAVTEDELGQLDETIDEAAESTGVFSNRLTDLAEDLTSTRVAMLRARLEADRLAASFAEEESVGRGGLEFLGGPDPFDTPPTAPPTSDELRAGERAAEAARRAAEDARREAERAAEELRRAQDRALQESIQQANFFAGIIVGALRDRAQAELDIRLQSIRDDVDATRAGAEERLRVLDEERTRTIEGIRAVTAARIDALNDQIDALSDAARDERRAELQRRLALAFDAKARAAIESQLLALDREEQRAALQEEIAAVRDSEADQIKAAEQGFDARERVIEEETRAALEALDEQEQAARNTYAEITDEYALQAEARRLIEQGNQEDIVRLLNDFAPFWRVAGINLGEQLINGVRQSNLPQFIFDMLQAISEASGTLFSAGGSSFFAGVGAGAGAGGGGGGGGGGSSERVKVTDTLLKAVIAELHSKGTATIPANNMLTDTFQQFANLGFGTFDQSDDGTGVFTAAGVGQLLEILSNLEALLAAGLGKFTTTGPFLHTGGVVTGSGLVNLQQGEVVVNPERGQAAPGGAVFNRGAFEGMFDGSTFSGTPDENMAAARAQWQGFMDDSLRRGAFVGGAGAV